MSTLNDIYVLDKCNLYDGATILDGGEMAEGDLRALNASFNIENAGAVRYKEVFFLANDYNNVTVPIMIDEDVLRTRTIVIRLYNNASQIRMPRYIQLYGNFNWISSSEPLNIILAPLFSNITETYTSLPIVYDGSNQSPSHKIGIIFSDSIYSLNNTDNVLDCSGMGGTYRSFYMAKIIIKSTTSKEIVLADNHKEAATTGLLEYL